MKKFTNFLKGRKDVKVVEIEVADDDASKPSKLSSLMKRKSASSTSLQLKSDFAGNQSYQLDAVSISNDKSFTKLHIACWVGDVSKVKKLGKKFQVNIKDSEGRTPLHLAASRGFLDIANYLLGCSANLDLEDSHGKTSLHKAVEADHQSVISLLIDCGANILAEDQNGNSPLHLALRDGLTNTALMLLGRGANESQTNNAGSTPLHVVASTKDLVMARKLLAMGADIDCLDSNGRTPLMLSCSYGIIPMVSFFLEAGANTEIMDLENQRARDFALLTNNREILNLLNRNSDKAKKYESPLKAVINNSKSPVKKNEDESSWSDSSTSIAKKSEKRRISVYPAPEADFSWSDSSSSAGVSTSKRKESIYVLDTLKIDQNKVAAQKKLNEMMAELGVSDFSDSEMESGDILNYTPSSIDESNERSRVSGTLQSPVKQPQVRQRKLIPASPIGFDKSSSLASIESQESSPEKSLDNLCQDGFLEKVSPVSPQKSCDEIHEIINSNLPEEVKQIPPVAPQRRKRSMDSSQSSNSKWSDSSTSEALKEISEEKKSVSNKPSSNFFIKIEIDDQGTKIEETVGSSDSSFDESSKEEKKKESPVKEPELKEIAEIQEYNTGFDIEPVLPINQESMNLIEKTEESQIQKDLQDTEDNKDYSLEDILDGSSFDSSDSFEEELELNGEHEESSKPTGIDEIQGVVGEIESNETEVEKPELVFLGDVEGSLNHDQDSEVLIENKIKENDLDSTSLSKSIDLQKEMGSNFTLDSFPVNSPTGTLGRASTLQGADEMWCENPKREILKEMDHLKPEISKAAASNSDSSPTISEYEDEPKEYDGILDKEDTDDDSPSDFSHQENIINSKRVEDPITSERMNSPSRISDIQAVVMRYQVSVNKERGRLKCSNHKLNSLKKECAQLKSHLKSIEESKKDLDKQMIDVKSTLENTKYNLKEALEQKETTEIILSKIKEKYENNQAALEKEIMSRKKLLEDSNEKSQKIEEYITALKSVENSLNVTENLNCKLKEENQNIKLSLDNENKQSIEVRSVYVETDPLDEIETIQTETDMFASNKETVGMLTKKIEELEGDIKEALAYNDDMEKLISAKQKKHDLEVNQLHNQCDALKTEQILLKNQLRSEDCLEDFEKLKEKHHILETQGAELSSRLTDTQSELEITRALMEEVTVDLRKEIALATEEKDSLSLQLHKELRYHQEMESQLKHFQQEADSLKEKFETEKTTMTEQIRNLTNENDDLLVLLRYRNENIALLENQLSESNNEQMELRERNDINDETITSLKRQLRSQNPNESPIASSSDRQEVRSLKMENEALKTQIQESESKLREAEWMRESFALAKQDVSKFREELERTLAGLQERQLEGVGRSKAQFQFNENDELRDRYRLQDIELRKTRAELEEFKNKNERKLSLLSEETKKALHSLTNQQEQLSSLKENEKEMYNKLKLERQSSVELELTKHTLFKDLQHIMSSKSGECLSTQESQLTERINALNHQMEFLQHKIAVDKELRTYDESGQINSLKLELLKLQTEQASKLNHLETMIHYSRSAQPLQHSQNEMNPQNFLALYKDIVATTQDHLILNNNLKPKEPNLANHDFSKTKNQLMDDVINLRSSLQVNKFQCEQLLKEKNSASLPLFTPKKSIPLVEDVSMFKKIPPPTKPRPIRK